MKKDRPSTGPYGRAKYDHDAGRWTTCLTDEGKSFCAAELAKWQNRPIRVLKTVNPWLYRVSIESMGLDDVEAECMLAWTRATIQFEPARGFKFSTYAGWAMNNTVHRAMTGIEMRGRERDGERMFKRMFQEGFVRPDQMDQYEAGGWDLFAEGEESEPREDRKELCLKVLGSVDDRERFLLWMVCGMGKTLAWAEEKLGISKERVRQIVKKAKEKVNRKMDEDGRVKNAA